MSSNSFFVRSLFSFVLLLLLFLCFFWGLRLIIICQLIRRRNMSIKSLQGRRHCCVFWIKREYTETVPLCWKINTVVSALKTYNYGLHAKSSAYVSEHAGCAADESVAPTDITWRHCCTRGSLFDNSICCTFARRLRCLEQMMTFISLWFPVSGSDVVVLSQWEVIREVNQCFAISRKNICEHNDNSYHAKRSIVTS